MDDVRSLYCQRVFVLITWGFQWSVVDKAEGVFGASELGPSDIGAGGPVRENSALRA